MAIPNKIFEQCTTSLPSLSGKCYAITGTTSGTGYHACVAAIEKQVACLLLLNRQSERSKAAEAELKALAIGKGTVVHAVDCDLQSFASVARAASEVNDLAAAYGGLDGCVNNAGVMALPDLRTPDGYDVQMQTNFLSHFLLVRLLMPSLEAAAAARGEARVVQHSSGARSGRDQADRIGMLETKFFQPASEGELGGNAMPACSARYHQTKLAASVFAMALHERLAASGSRVKSLCAEPGVAATSLIPNLTQAHKETGTAPTQGASLSTRFPGVQSAADGACSLMEAAFGAGANSGDFFMPGDLVKKTVVGMPVRCITGGCPTPTQEHIKKRFENEKLTVDPANHQLLWTESERATGERFLAALTKSKL